MSNPCSETLLIFHFLEAIQNKSVLKFYTHFLDKHQLPIEVKPYYATKNVNRTTISPIIRGHRTQGLTHLLLDRQAKHMWLIGSCP